MKRSEILSQAVLRIAPLSEIEAIGLALYDIVAQCYRLCFFGFSIWDHSRNVFFERVLWPRKAEPIHLRIEDLNDYGFGQVIKSGEPRLVADIEKESIRDGEWKARKSFGTRSYLTLPLEIQEQLIGALGFGSPEPAHFSIADIHLLNPLVKILSIKLDSLGIRPPPRLEIPPPPRQPIFLIGSNPRLCGRIERSLPDDIPIIREIDLTQGLRKARLAPLAIYATSTLRRKDAEEIVLRLRGLPVRLVIFSGKVHPAVTRNLEAYGAGSRLLILAGLDEIRFFEKRLTSLYYSAILRPDWGALGLSEDLNPEMERLIELIGQDLLRPWNVTTLANEIGFSRHQVARRIRSATGMHAKHFLDCLRSQVLDYYRQEGLIKGEELATLMGFSSAKKLYEWRTRHQDTVSS